MSDLHSNGPAERPLEDALRRLQRSYADALLAGHDIAAEAVVREAMETGLSESAISDGVIAPAMRLVGDMWEASLLGVADEHHATEITTRVLALQREAFRVAARRAAHPVLLAAVEGERHVIGVAMAGSAILHAGYDVRELGPDLPTDALAAAVRRHRPAVVGLTATMPASARVAAEAIRAVRDIDPAVGVVIGGAAASPQLSATPGVAICDHVSDAVQIIDGLLQRAPHN